ncbi:MAG: ABC transporter substrate-binding protein, partial [Deltaproteobacteria bacterium]|nr:ABC transporter substrate-binding protein [Deltaproteobacteria bacterium]
MARNKFFLIIIIILLAFSAGCNEKTTQDNSAQAGAKTDGQKPASAGDSKPDYGDMLIRGSIGDASVLLPVLASDSASGDINSLIYNGLVKYDKDINLIGELAERWDISEDKLRIRFFLRKDVKWHDGKPFTAKDVEYTYKVYVDPKTPTAYSTDFLKVKELRVIDDYTVEMVYEKPYAPALGSWGQGILPSHLLENVDITESPLKRHPIGTGPYKFKDWVKEKKITVDSFHDYF